MPVTKHIICLYMNYKIQCRGYRCQLVSAVETARCPSNHGWCPTGEGVPPRQTWQAGGDEGRVRPRGVSWSSWGARGQMVWSL